MQERCKWPEIGQVRSSSLLWAPAKVETIAQLTSRQVLFVCVCSHPLSGRMYDASRRARAEVSRLALWLLNHRSLAAIGCWLSAQLDSTRLDSPNRASPKPNKPVQVSERANERTNSAEIDTSSRKSLVIARPPSNSETRRHLAPTARNRWLPPSRVVVCVCLCAFEASKLSIGLVSLERAPILQGQFEWQTSELAPASD